MASKTLKYLADFIDKKAGSIADDASEKAKHAALEMVKYLTNVTPVDTSKALSNWVVSIGNPPTSDIEAHNPGQYGSTASSSAAVAVSDAEKVLEGKQPGQDLYVSNKADYIAELNRGSSKQHPGGFVEAAIVIGKNAVKSNAKAKRKG
jgi:hypothetical protein